MRTLISCVSFIVFFTSCQSVHKRSREFALDTLWVTSFSEESNTGFRRLNRSSPVPLQLPTKELIVFGNPYNGVQAVDVNSGSKVWEYSFKHGTEAKLAVEGTFVFVAANDGFVYAIDGETGLLMWSFPTRSENLAELVVHQGLVYILSSQNTLFAVEAVSGKRVWIYTRPDNSLFSIRGSGRPATIGDKLFVGFGDGALVAFKANSGQVLWEREFSVNKRFRDLDSDILVYQDSLLVGGFDEAVYRIEYETGLTKWKSEGGMFGSFALLGEKVCFAQTELKLRCLEIGDGSAFLDIPIKEGIASSPTFLNSYLVFGESQGPIRVWDIKEKREVSRFYSGRGLVAAPFTDSKKGRIYFVSNESYLYALEARWNYVTF